MSERIHVTVEVDTDELRKWADHHADRGHHGVAHVLYKAASDGESLTEQAIRAAVETECAEWVAIVEDPYAKPVWVQGHSHAEPVCAWPDCRVCLTPDEMVLARLDARANQIGGA